MQESLSRLSEIDVDKLHAWLYSKKVLDRFIGKGQLHGHFMIIGMVWEFGLGVLEDVSIDSPNGYGGVLG